MWYVHGAMQPPTDLVPLPTQPWSERPIALPLDVEECRTALWYCRGNISRAAELIKVTPARLRAFVNGSPRLRREVDEAREQIQDTAEDVVYEALLDDQDKGRRDSMARFVLQNLGKSRGYGTAKGVTVNNTKGGVVVIQWEDGTTFGGPDGQTIEGEVVREAAE